MKKYFQLLFLLLILLSGCKSNPEAYNTTYQRLKVKEEAMMDAKARVAMDVPKNVSPGDSSAGYAAERLTLILGEESNFAVYGVVTKSFINRTNARGYYSRVLEKGYPAVLVQNEEMMFRIIVASFQTKEEAENKLKDFKASFPDAYILVRMQ